VTPPAPDSWPLAVPAFAGAADRRAALSGRVAVITGASRGLGAGMAAHLATEGVILGLCARHRPELVAATRPRVHDGLVEHAVVPLTAAVDVTDAAALCEFGDHVVGRFGRIDLWINNAGVLVPIGPLADADPDALAQNVDVNVRGVLYGSRWFARHVRRRGGGGVLVNITSGAAQRPYVGWAAYCAAKAAVDMCTEVVALEGRSWGLRAHAVAPGVVDTDMQALIRSTDEADFPEVAAFRAMADHHAFNTPTWVADRILELAFAGTALTQVRLRVPDEPLARPAR
jgi:NAD(P)-dependent dehydrogenase (short-subunit alcohol dehydrogenase family)